MEFFYGTTAAAIESMYCQLLQEKRAIHAHRDVLAWNQNIRFEKKSSSMQLYINAHQKCVTKKCWSPKTTLEAIDSISNSYIYVLSKEPSVELPREY